MTHMIYNVGGVILHIKDYLRAMSHRWRHEHEHDTRGYHKIFDHRGNRNLDAEQRRKPVHVLRVEGLNCPDWLESYILSGTRQTVRRSCSGLRKRIWERQGIWAKRISDRYSDCDTHVVSEIPERGCA